MDEARRQLVEASLERAEADHEAARRVEPHDAEHDILYGIAAFHWQQSAEKSVKAFLVSRKVSFGRTHDVSELVGLAAKLDDDFRGLRELAASLAPFAVEVRYPGDLAQPSKDEYDEVKRVALAIIELSRDKIGRVEDE